MKKLLSVILILTLIVWAAPAGSFRIFAGQSGDFTYSVMDDKAEITGYSGSQTNLVIPGLLDGYIVNGIADMVFQNHSEFTGVVLPDSLEYIGNNTFSGCDGLTGVLIPNNVESIGTNAFKDCTGLTSLTLGSKVVEIGDAAFFNCILISSLVIPDSVTHIRSYAFADCTGLNSLSIGIGVALIDSYVFSNCTGLTSLTLPETVTRIGDGAFMGCSGLTGIVIPGSVTQIGHLAFKNCSEITDVTLNEGVLVIDQMAFENCVKISDILIPSSVTAIGDNAFINCSGLTSVIIDDSITSVGISAFEDCTGLTSLDLGTGVTFIGQRAFFNCTGLVNVIIPDSVTDIRDSAFELCTGLTSVTIGASVTNIGTTAFSRCNKLTEVTIPDSVTSLLDYAFENCTGLVNVSIGNGVLIINDGAFYGCTGITGLTIGNSVSRIRNGAFYGCTGLTSVIIPDSVTIIDDSSFQGCSGMTSLTLGSGLITISNNAFNDCSSITEVNIPDSVTSIGYNSFDNCSGITALSIGNGVTTIDTNAFSNCTGITELTLGNSLVSIGMNAFWHCVGLTNIIIPDSVTTIGRSSFSMCTGLQSVVIGDCVTGIGANAFEDCFNFTGVYIPPSVTTIGNDAFFSCDKLTIYGVAESFAQTYANQNDIPFVAGNIPEPPVAPVDLISTGKTDTTVDLSWSEVPGVTGYNVYLGATKLNPVPIPATNFTVNELNANTTYIFTVKAVNITVESPSSAPLSVTTNPDSTPPIITIDEYPTSPTRQNITVTASTNEGTLNTDNYTFTENGSFDFIATDESNNVTIVTVTITNIDRTSPVVTGVETVCSYKSSRTIGFNEGSAIIDFYDGTTHINGVEILSGSTVSLEGTYTLIVTDEAGNSTIVAFKIDKTAPVITIDPYDDTTPTNQDITVTASVNEGTLFESSHTFSENGTYQFIAIDAAGNIATKLITIKNIDRIAPIVGGVEEGCSYDIATITFNEGTAELNGNYCWSYYVVRESGNYQLVVTDATGNSTTVNFTINSTPYCCENGYITGIAPNTSLIDFESNLNILSSETTKIFGADEDEIIGGSKGSMNAATGMYVQIYSNNIVMATRTIVVFGDVSGDGLIDISDLTTMKSCLLNITLLTGAFKAAGILGDRQNISVSDLLALKKHLVGLNSITQEPPGGPVEASVPVDFKGTSLGDPSKNPVPPGGGTHELTATYLNNSSAIKTTVFVAYVVKNGQVVSTFNIDKTFAPYEEYTFSHSTYIPPTNDGSIVEVYFLMVDSLVTMKTKHDTAKNCIMNVR